MKASLVCATFNRGNLLSRALHCLSRQTMPFSDWEYCLIDDGSSDGTLDICKTWIGRGLQIRVFDAAKDLGLPKEPGKWRDGCALRNAASTFAFSEVIVSSHPEILVPPDALQTMYGTAKANHDAWVTAIPYWLPEQDVDSVAWQSDLSALRQLPGFYDPSWPDKANAPGSIDYRNQNQEVRDTWESEVFWAMTMAKWRWMGGFRNFDVWGPVDMDFMNRRKKIGIPTVIAKSAASPAPSKSLMVYHQWHPSPRDMDKAHAAMAGCNYPDAESARKAGSLYPVYYHGHRERADNGTDGILWDHVYRYQWIAGYCQRPGMVVLDIPMGTGHGCLAFADKVGYHGFDIDAESVEWALKHYGAINRWFKVGSMTRIPMENDSVDQAVCFEGIEHIAEQKAFVSELYRVLRPGGTFVISTPQKGTAQGTAWDKYMLTPTELYALFDDERWRNLDWFYQQSYGNSEENRVKAGTPPKSAEIMLLGGTKR